MQSLYIASLTRPYIFRSPAPGHEYAAWIISNDPTQTATERDEIASALISSGCRYAVCSGFECAKWDDAIDQAFLASADFDPADDTFVMTTWHEDEPLQEVAEFFVRHTAFDSFAPDIFVCDWNEAADCTGEN